MQISFLSPFRILLLVAISSFAFAVLSIAHGQSTLDSIEEWTRLPADQRQSFEDLPIASKAISKMEAAKIKSILWQDHVEQLRVERQQEWQDKVIKLNDLEMKFEYRVFGDKPESGRRLYISMHGGGQTRPSVNESQWRNQIRLYEPKEGVYLAPRAPTDSWNMWHQGHIDQFFQRIIQDAILFEDVDPNRVYLMGYSAGGDGAYQLAPRMADSLAAAAMMAGHPNDASPLGLRNIGFTIHVGANDSAFDRNKVAEQWKSKLADLKAQDPRGYSHQVTIHAGMGHWMKRRDAVAVDWMSKFQRNASPDKIVWSQDDVTRDNFYWLSIPSGGVKKGQSIVVERSGQNFEISSTTRVSSFKLLLNDNIVDLEQPVSVSFKDETILRSTAERKPIRIFKSIKRFGDADRVYSAELTVKVPSSEGESKQ